MINSSQSLEPQESLQAVAQSKRNITIGLPSVGQNRGSRLFPLTPEVVAMLIQRGYIVNIEKNAAEAIHYDDITYSNVGANIVDNSVALASDIVIALAPLYPKEIAMMRRGAMLLTLVAAIEAIAATAREILRRGITTIFLDHIHDHRDNRPIADILNEISGRAAISVASSLLADSSHGKGILLGGVAGIIPCEVVVIGSKLSAIAAAQSAAGLGAIVRMFDDNIYRLRDAMSEACGNIITSVPHPRVIRAALRTADVIIVASSNCLVIEASDIELLKSGVIIIDVTSHVGRTFPSLEVVDYSRDRHRPMSANRRQIVYSHVGYTVPRTIAMAIGSSLLPFFDNLSDMGNDMRHAIEANNQLKPAVASFAGKATHKKFAKVVGERLININIFLSLS